MEDQATIARPAPPADPGTPDTHAAATDEAARQVVDHLAAARKAARDAREARKTFIADQYLRGVRIIDIARQLSALADTLDLDPRERAQFGVSESSVHLALRVAGLK